MRHGNFSGQPETIWLTESGSDRRMQLIRDITFTDPSPKPWEARAGAIVDGASIPRALWSVVGSPYTGNYRRASIVHDIACDEAGSDKAKRREADRMFFHACRAGGCSTRQSIILYIGVRIGAMALSVPAWKAAAECESDGPRVRRTVEELRLEREFEAIAERVLELGETDDPIVLERNTDQVLLAAIGVTD